MIGCSFVVNRKFFGDIGLLDPGMDVYGGENIELGIKVGGMTSCPLDLFESSWRGIESFLLADECQAPQPHHVNVTATASQMGDLGVLFFKG
jgi:hypothetical protein